MFHNAAQMPVGAFCYGDKEQLDCLARLDLHSMGDMWRYIAASTPLVDEANLPQLFINVTLSVFAPTAARRSSSISTSFTESAASFLEARGPTNGSPLKCQPHDLKGTNRLSCLLNILLIQNPFGSTKIAIAEAIYDRAWR